MSPRGRSFLVVLAACVLLAGFVAQCVDLARRTSATYDEPRHLAEGTSYWANGDYRLANGDLLFAQRLAGAGVWWSAATFPSKARQTALNNYPDAIGAEFLYASGNEPVAVVAAGRLMITLAGAALGGVVFWWARSAFGDIGALAALTVFVSCPPLVANASLATTDLVTTLWFTLAVVGYWRLLCAPSIARGAVAGVALGLLLLTKASAPGFAAIAGGLLACRLWRGPKPFAWSRAAVAHVAMAAATIVAIWAFFGFAARPGGYDFPWETLGPGTRVHRMITALRELKLLPDPFLWELSGLRHLVNKRYNFFAGEHYYGGSWGFFPAAFLFKTPPTTLLLLALAAVISIATVVRKKRSSESAAPGWSGDVLTPLWMIVLGYAALCIASRVNVGHRHLLPIYPAVCVLAGGAAAWLVRAGGGRAAAGVALLGLGVAEAATLHGRQHTYFSPLAGGPHNGHRWFVDSTNDWGANLPEIAAWQHTIIAREPAAVFFVGHLGVDAIEAYGVHGTLLHGREEMDALHRGYFILSASALHMGYVFQPGPYTAELENYYQRTLAAEHAGTASDAERSHRRRLAAARLSAFCRQRAADERIGDVYFVFRLSDAEVERALRGPLPPGLPEPEQHTR